MAVYLRQKAFMTIQALLKSEPINKRTDILAIARNGIETKYLKGIQSYTSLSDKELISILPISQRQLVRYAPTHILNKEITTHLIQLIELFQKGYSLFGQKKFQLWMRTTNKVLNDNVPLALMDTSLGIEMIEDVLGRIEHGVYS